jgi:hypothetical protein
MRRDQSIHHFPTPSGWFISRFSGGSSCSVHRASCLEGYLNTCGLFVAPRLFSGRGLIIFGDFWGFLIKTMSPPCLFMLDLFVAGLVCLARKSPFCLLCLLQDSFTIPHDREICVSFYDLWCFWICWSMQVSILRQCCHLSVPVLVVDFGLIWYLHHCMAQKSRFTCWVQGVVGAYINFMLMAGPCTKTYTLN